MNALAVLKREVAKAGSQKNAAKSLGISTQYMNDLIRERRDFSDAVLAKLGLERRIVKRIARHPNGKTPKAKVSD